MEECSLFTPQMQWEKISAFPGNAEVKVLRDEPSIMGRTLLVHLPVGEHIRPHDHPAGVQHYILEGEYESEGKTFVAGTFRFFPRHAELASISTKTGATILIIYDPVILER